MMCVTIIPMMMKSNTKSSASFVITTSGFLSSGFANTVLRNANSAPAGFGQVMPSAHAFVKQ